MDFPLACRVKNPLHQDGAHICALKNLWGKTGPAVKAGSVIQMFWPPHRPDERGCKWMIFYGQVKHVVDYGYLVNRGREHQNK